MVSFEKSIMNQGFFTTKQTESKFRPDGKTYSCVSCGLCRNVLNPKMKPFGNFKKGILNIGEAPGEIEDKRGKPWQGKTGRLLQKTYRRLGIDLFEDCLNVNAVNCRPIDKEGINRTPNNYEIDCCRKNILQTIERYRPKVIVLLGNSALYCLLAHRWKKDLGGIMKWRGWAIPDQDFNTWICPMFHSSYVSRSEKEVETVWIQDLERAIRQTNERFPEHQYFPVYQEPNIETIEDLSILSALQGKYGDHIIKIDKVAIDYETTGLKPHSKGHRIICAAVAISENKCFVFMMPKSRKARQPFIDLLANPNIGKIAHNIKFEEVWGVKQLQQPIQNWIWDSMLAAHVLDNRPGITGLKFQTYVNFGIVDYASEITSYLQATTKGGNNMNRIYELLKQPGGQEKLLEYCGLDAIYAYRLSMLQMELMNYNDLPF